MVERHTTDAGRKDHYNEVILEAASWIANLPHSIEAIIQSAEEDGDQARIVHELFNAEFGLSHPVPLVLFDVLAEEPFQILKS